MLNPRDVSDAEIAREVRTLRTLRRRSGSSAGPGALPLDPDLPPPTSTSHQPYPLEASTSAGYSSNDDVTLAPALDGDHFWVPAHLHPQIAPQDFRNFLKSHTHADPENADSSDAGEAAGLARSPSWLARRDSRRGLGGDSLGRKRSMLSKQYTPRAGDDVENERPPLPNRQRASIYGGRSGEKGLTLEDLQKLEMLVEEAAESDDPAEMTRILRRSLSINAQQGGSSLLGDDVPIRGDEATSMGSRPSSILRRSAHTKIRKAGLAGDGGGHRFASTRKGRMSAAPVIDIPGLEDDDDAGSASGSSSQNRTAPASDESEDTQRASSGDSHGDEDLNQSRRPSGGSTDETAIFDAYARDSRQSSLSNDSSISGGSPSPEHSPPRISTNLPPILELPRSGSDDYEYYKEDGETTPTKDNTDPFTAFRRPSPGIEFAEARPGAANLPGSLGLHIPGDDIRRSPPSPSTPRASHHDLPPGMAAPASRQAPSHGVPVQPQPSKDEPIPVQRPPMNRNDSSAASLREKEREKEKKGGGLFSKKKPSKKEKESFLGSLFGGSKKKQEEPVSSVANFSSAGPAAAAALLGTSKSARSMGTSPGASPTIGSFAQFARYPIHVERAVYRLSHIKLANARRPLFEQVLISNLMFWYLGIIGRNVAEEKKQNAEDEKREPAKSPSKGTPPRPLDSGIAGTPAVRMIETMPPQTASGKKTGLTKPDRRQPGRDAEAPMRSPSYGMQNVQVDNEVRTATMSMAAMGMKGGRPSIPAQPGPPYQQVQPQSYAGYPQQNAQQMAYHPHPGQPQPQPPYPGQPQRSNSTPSQHRPMSPPSSQATRPVSDHTGITGPRDPRDPPAGPNQRSPPQPAFGHPLPNGMTSSQSMTDMRDNRPRGYSNPPSQHPPSPHQLGPYPQVRQSTSPPPASNGQSPTARRIVSGPNGPPSHPTGDRAPQHSGPQPGQIFRLPQQAAGAYVQRPPGPSINGSPGGPVLGRPYPPGPPLGARPGPVPANGYGGPPSPHGGRPPPHPAFANGARPGVPWEPPQRLPPGASAPPSGESPYRNPSQPQMRPAPMPNGYDPRSYPPPNQPDFSQPAPGQQYGGVQHRQPSMPGSPGALRPMARPGPSPGQVYNPYQGAPHAGQRQPSGDQEMYRRAHQPQPVQQAPYGGHHR